MLERFRGHISKGGGAAVLDLDSEPFRVAKPVRISFDGGPVELILGKQKLHLRPEIGITPEPRSGGKDWLLVDPKRFYSEVAGFERVSLAIRSSSDALTSA